MDAAPPTRIWTSLAVLCLLAAAFLYLVSVSSIQGLGASDPAGNAMSAGFAFLSGLLLWGVLAGFLLLCCIPARLPGLVLGLGAGAVGRRRRPR